MKIGIIGAGVIGGTLGTLWLARGHEIFYGTRNPKDVKTPAGVRSGTPEQAAAFGDAILMAVPMGAMPGLARRLGNLVAGKTVIDAGNAYERREPQVAHAIAELGHGSGRWVAHLLPRAHVVKGFNTVYFETLRASSGTMNPVGIPLAGDEPGALEEARLLVLEAGFEPVVIGGLDRARDFDVGTPAWNTGASAARLRHLLDAPAAGVSPPSR